MSDEEVTETQDNHTAKVERFQRQLRCKLTEREMSERSKRAAHLVSELDEKEAARKAANDLAKAQMGELDAELHRISAEVRDESTQRDVRCERVFFFRTGNVVERRMDTGETISERAMSDWERQQELPLDDGDDPDEPEPEAETAKKPKRGRKARNGASA